MDGNPVIPTLPADIYNRFVELEVVPTAVVVLKEGGDHELFLAEGVAVDPEANVVVRDLKLPEVLIQRIGCSIIYTKYGPIKVSCG